VTQRSRQAAVSYYLAEQIEQTSDEQNAADPAWALRDPVHHQLSSPSGYGDSRRAGLARSAVHQVLSQGQQEIRGTLQTLKALARRLAAMPGDRSIILVSSGYYLAARPALGSDGGCRTARCIPT